MAANYNEFLGDYTGYGRRGMTAGQHTFFNNSPMTAISTIDPSLNSPTQYAYAPANLDKPMVTKPLRPGEGDPGTSTPPGLDLTAPGLTPDAAINAVRGAARGADFGTLMTSALGNMVAPGLGTLASGALSGELGKGLETHRGTLAHLGYTDPALTQSKASYMTNYPSLYTVAEHLSKVTEPITRQVNKVVDPLVTFFDKDGKNLTKQAPRTTPLRRPPSIPVVVKKPVPMLPARRFDIMRHIPARRQDPPLTVFSRLGPQPPQTPALPVSPEPGVTPVAPDTRINPFRPEKPLDRGDAMGGAGLGNMGGEMGMYT